MAGRHVDDGAVEPGGGGGAAVWENMPPRKRLTSCAELCRFEEPVVAPSGPPSQPVSER
jgi:hypothetical protein